MVLAGTLARAQAPPGNRLDLDPPAQRQFILDNANVITPADQQQIRQTCDRLLTEHATPIIVVTIPDMASCGGGGLRIETFATLLFDQWRIGHPTLNGQNWNTGILLLVSTGDRRARIELGAGWSHEKDELCQQIMDQQIIPRFRQGDYSGGILAGVQALDQMARGKPLPQARRSAWYYVLIFGGIALLVWTAVSLMRSGMTGWAWVFWGAVFAVIGYLLYQMITSRRSGFGGFSGGSFGGGFSGGGGASGSW